MIMEQFEEYTKTVLTLIQKELPDCVDIDADEDGYAILIMGDGKTMMQQEFNIGNIKTLMLQWNVQCLLYCILNG
jgi:hypothetical protein